MPRLSDWKLKRCTKRRVSRVSPSRSALSVYCFLSADVSQRPRRFPSQVMQSTRRKPKVGLQVVFATSIWHSCVSLSIFVCHCHYLKQLVVALNYSHFCTLPCNRLVYLSPIVAKLCQLEGILYPQTNLDMLDSRVCMGISSNEYSCTMDVSHCRLDHPRSMVRSVLVLFFLLSPDFFSKYHRYSHNATLNIL